MIDRNVLIESHFQSKSLLLSSSYISVFLSNFLGIHFSLFVLARPAADHRVQIPTTTPFQ